MRFRISRLAGLIAFCALGFAALRQASPMTDQIVFTATLAVLALATILALQQCGRVRAYWIGFAVAGGLYFLASTSPTMAPRLITSRLLANLGNYLPDPNALLAEHARPPISENQPYIPPTTAWNGGGQRIRLTRLWDPWDFNEWIPTIGHNLSTWVAGWIGGMTSLVIRTRAKQREWPGLRQG